MTSENMDLFLENQTLKNEFVARGLDLSEVFCPTPEDLRRENRFLLELLDWVDKYAVCNSRRAMEAEGYHFPPIDPDISPDNDWYRFKLWLQGKPLHQPLKDRLPHSYTPKSSDQLTEEELLCEMEKLTELLARIRVSVDLVEDLPPRLAYEHLLETLSDEFDMITEGHWHLTGCTGYCPGCFQRPWCPTGSTSCWPEDAEAGQIFFVEPVKRYVSASPTSLRILQKLQVEEDHALEQCRDKGTGPEEPEPLDLDEDDLPF